MMELMKAIKLDYANNSPQIRWENVPYPHPTAEGQVLIRVKAAGVNRPDILQRDRMYTPPADASPILGLEVAGVVEQVFGESRWRAGDEVCALTHGGGYAEYVWVDERHCLPKPAGWSFAEAASLPETYFTVWFNVFMQGKLGNSQKETLLVHAGASGIGVAAIQMAKALGHRVVITARKEEQLKLCQDIGADAAILLDELWVKKVQELSGSIHVILDMLGETTVSGNIKVLGKGGRLVWIAFLTGAKVTVPIPQIMEKQISLTGSFLRPQSFNVKAGIAEGLRAQIWPKIASGVIKPIVEKVFPIQEVEKAHAWLEKGGHVGKIVLTV
ncbi:NAD(P)H-quinone oxidoreductase [Sphingobacterium sp. lm-10]|uniref:NAD(P)H-quinone oxidoreductase n=1 Tax=Sphingobacterium sp. lm-10 TaxID=2944904 RepID=UPI00202101EE|nr:NAD(P)H-quinone oxidoreductase [Sphingobacterium sp. lm-10]MCL7986830.1 NAD(P)H-quinone oxidoreductase [Sphingobacterium sp. lm-10]